MAYRFRQHEAVQSGWRRIVREQIDQALADLSRPPAERDAMVHALRRRLKRIRAALRLVSGSLDCALREDKLLRDLGRTLSATRDARVVVDTLASIRCQPTDFVDIEEALRCHPDAACDAADFDRKVSFVVAALTELRMRNHDWRLSKSGWAALAPGLKRAYGRSRAAMRKASAHPDAEHFHRWRKQTKHVWHQLELLTPMWPGVMKPLAEQFGWVARELGRDHDLAVVAEKASRLSVDGGAVAMDALMARIAEEQTAIRARLLPLGEMLHAESASRFTARLGQYWGTWRKGPGGHGR